MTFNNTMNHTVTLPDRRTIRGALGSSVAAWARARSYPPAAVHVAIQRYAGKPVDMTAVWGDQTRGILQSLNEAVQTARSAA